jgi:FixJ family two-component response regulator
VPIDDALEISDSRDTDIERTILAKEVQKMGRSQDRRIVELIMQGATSREIAAVLHISKTKAQSVWRRVRERLMHGVE